MFRAGIIGLGRIGVEFDDCHASAYIDCPDTDLVASCDIKKEALYRDYMEMVRKEKLDIVSVCTPPETHCQIVCDICPFVKAIYLEKPIALTLEDADKMIAICRATRVILLINHQRSFMRPKFRFSRGIFNTGTHMFDLLRQLFGEVRYLTDRNVTFESGLVCDIEEVETDKAIFELDCTHNGDRMILAGVKRLVEYIETRQEGNAPDARRALELCIKYAELQTSHN